MTNYEIIGGRRYRDNTAEALRTFGDWLVDDTIRDAVKVMIEGGRNGHALAEAKRKEAKKQSHVARIAWHTIADYDDDLPKAHDYVNTQEAHEKRRRLSGELKHSKSSLQEIHYEKKQQRLF